MRDVTEVRLCLDRPASAQRLAAAAVLAGRGIVAGEEEDDLSRERPSPLARWRGAFSLTTEAILNRPSKGEGFHWRFAGDGERQMPWKQVLALHENRHGELVPLVQKNILPDTYAQVTQAPHQLLLCSLAFCIGMAIVFFIRALASKKDQIKK